MTTIPALATAALIAASQPAPTPQEILDARGGCYDVALIGRIEAVDGFVDLNDLLPASDESLWWGGISSVLVRKEVQLIGQSPKLDWYKVIMSAQPLPTAKLLILAKTHPSGVPIVIHFESWRKGGRSSELERRMADAPFDRCP